MSKKNRHSWRKTTPAAQPSPATTEPRVLTSGALETASLAGAAPVPADLSPISPAQLAANRANAQLSTGPRTPAGLAKSSKNAVKSALTGRTVLLPTDDVEEYAAFLAEWQRDLNPVGQAECELVQTIVDCYWRLRRIQELEYALYAHGHRQFESAFADEPEPDRHSMTILQAHLTYQKELRNLHIQEARLDRKRSKAMAELDRLQADRKTNDETLDRAATANRAATAKERSMSDAEFFAALDAGYVPPSIASQLAHMQALNENGFDFSSAASSSASVIASELPAEPEPAAA